MSEEERPIFRQRDRLGATLEVYARPRGTVLFVGAGVHFTPRDLERLIFALEVHRDTWKVKRRGRH